MKPSAGRCIACGPIGSGPNTGSRVLIHATHEKKWRDRLSALALRHPAWGLGFQDEVGWSRLAQPNLHTWTDDKPLHLVQNEPERHAPEPRAVACYGLLRADPQGMLLRFVDGRPVRAVTPPFLAWLTAWLAAEGTTSNTQPNQATGQNHHGSAGPTLPDPAGMTLMAHGITSGPLWDKIVNSLLGLDGDTHHRLRSLVSKAFTPRASAPLHDTIVEVLNELVDLRRAERRCDIVADIARPYPVPIICALLGCPRRTGNNSRLGRRFFSAFTFDLDGLDEPPRHGGMGRTRRLRRRDDRRDGDTRSTDDLLSDLIRAEEDGDRLDADELRMLAAGLLLAATDTTRNQVAASVDVFSITPDQWALLKRPEAGAERGRGNHAPIRRSRAARGAPLWRIPN